MNKTIDDKIEEILSICNASSEQITLMYNDYHTMRFKIVGMLNKFIFKELYDLGYYFYVNSNSEFVIWGGERK